MTDPAPGPRNPCLVAGLGNPGLAYCFTRHNAGFMVVDRLARQFGLAFEPFGRLGHGCRGLHGSQVFDLLKPATYMNRSGLAVGEWVDRKAIALDRLLVVSDDIHLPLGRLRFRRHGGAGGHLGLASIIGSLGTEDFSRLRIGIGPLPEGADQKPVDQAEFVLQNFLAAELVTLQTVIARAAEALSFWFETSDLDLCMSRFNG